MTVSPVSDTTHLEELVNGFTSTYEGFKFGDHTLNNTVRNIRYALEGEENTDWEAIYDGLELITFGSGGEIYAQAITLMRLIVDQGLVPDPDV